MCQRQQYLYTNETWYVGDKVKDDFNQEDKCAGTPSRLHAGQYDPSDVGSTRHTSSHEVLLAKCSDTGW